MEEKEHIKHYLDGSIWAKGKLLDDQMHGYWEWYDKDGVIMRSGHLNLGKPVGEWKTYDKQGRVSKVTKM